MVAAKAMMAEAMSRNERMFLSLIVNWLKERFYGRISISACAPGGSLLANSRCPHPDLAKLRLVSRPTTKAYFFSASVTTFLHLTVFFSLALYRHAVFLPPPAVLH